MSRRHDPRRCDQCQSLRMAVVAGVVLCTGDHAQECELCLNGPVDKSVDSVDNVS